ncbi:MAG: FliH/SctL family protein [bacterium]
MMRNGHQTGRTATVLAGKPAEELPLAKFEKFATRPVNYFRGIAPISEESSSCLSEDELAQRVEQQFEAERQLFAKERETAYQQGLEDGFAKGREEGYRQIRPAIDLLHDWNRMIQSEKTELARRYEGDVLELGFLIAKKILGEEIAARPDAIVGVVRQALRKVLHADSVTLRIHPDDWKVLEEARERLSAEGTVRMPLELKADSAVARGGCIIETESGLLDAGLESQLDRLRNLLTENNGEKVSERVDLDIAQ